MPYLATVKTMTFSGRRLEELRSRRRLTQHDLASGLRARGFGTTQTTVSRWEHGQQPDGVVLPALAAELECSISDFYAPDSEDDEEADSPLSHDDVDLYLSLHARVMRQTRREAEESLRELLRRAR